MHYNKDFLRELDKNKNKIIYARATALSIDELPVDQIEGRVTQGSINIDGSSAIRRSCSLTLVADDFNQSDYLWGLNTKFKLEIGVENNIDMTYPSIIWFNQGVYVITSFSSACSTTNFTITIQGKDKMCLLNGEVGGSIGVQTDFGTIEEENSDGIWSIRQIPIPEIIMNMIHSYGGEPYHNIIINDLDTQGLELLEYRYENAPLILYRKAKSNTYSNMLFLNDEITVFLDPLYERGMLLKDVPDHKFDQLLDTFTENNEPTIFYLQDGDPEGYCFTKIQYGDVAGYRATDLTYAGDLIANVGESITSVLDKIKNMLVEYEYFYDIDGRFVFQKKKSFISTLWGPSENGIQEIENATLLNNQHYYVFNGSDLIISFNNNPNLLNVKNDFSIWGQRKSVSGAQIPIHLRYAIDIKPQEYTSIGNFSESDIEEIKAYNLKYGTSLKEESPISITYSTHEIDNTEGNYVYVNDWREVLYQMAKDYFQYNFLTNFELKVKNNNPDIYNNNKTGYEQYYTDIEVCWRDLYNPTLGFEINNLKNELVEKQDELLIVNEQIPILQKDITDTNNKINEALTQTDLDIWHAVLLSKQGQYTDQVNLQKKLNTEIDNLKEKIAEKEDKILNYYQFTELEINKEGTRSLLESLFTMTELSYAYRNGKTQLCIPVDKISKLFDSEEEIIEIESNDVISADFDNLYLQVIDTIKNDRTGQVEYVYCVHYSNDRLYWNKNIFNNPGALNYWFDFLDTSGELNHFSVRAIGARTKAINETSIKSIYNREVPNVIFTNDITDEEKISSYRYIQIPNLENMFTISAQGKSAKDRLDELIYAHGYCNENVSISCIPIYYLEPNTRIHISDSKTKINGDYVISKMTIPLTYNGTMTITATKAAESLFF